MTNSSAFSLLVSDIGDQIGIPHLEPSHSGEVVFATSTGRMMGVTEAPDAVIAHITLPLSYEIAATVLNALKMAGEINGMERPIQVGYRDSDEGGTLVVAVRIPLAACTSEALIRAMDQLTQWSSQL